MVGKSTTKNVIGLYEELERSFTGEQYLDIVKCWEGNENSVVDFKTNYIQLLEILSVSYLEAGKYRISLSYVDLALEKYTGKYFTNSLNVDDEDDLKMFVLTKLEILQREDMQIKEYLLFQKFDRLFAKDIGFANRRQELLQITDNLFMRYVKCLGYLMVIYFSLSIISLIFKGQSVFPKVSLLLLVVYSIIIIFRKDIIKQVLNKLSRYS